jgi:hypothetical protein
MQLEELQQQWQRLDEKLERTVKLNDELLRLTVLQPARRRVNRWAVWPAIDIAFGLGVSLFAGSFLGKHWGTWSLVGPTSIVLTATIMLLIFSIRQLIRVSEIDWSGTVVDIQSSLSRIRMATIGQVKWIILLSPLIGFSGLIVGLQWLLDLLSEPHFILDKLNPWWVGGNYAFAVLFIPLGHAVIGFLAKRFQFRGWWQNLVADLSGTSLRKTKDELERWASLDYKESQEID